MHFPNRLALILSSVLRPIKIHVDSEFIKEPQTTLHLKDKLQNLRAIKTDVSNETLNVETFDNSATPTVGRGFVLRGSLTTEEPLITSLYTTTNSNPIFLKLISRWPALSGNFLLQAEDKPTD